MVVMHWLLWWNSYLNPWCYPLSYKKIQRDLFYLTLKKQTNNNGKVPSCVLNMVQVVTCHIVCTLASGANCLFVKDRIKYHPSHMLLLTILFVCFSKFICFPQINENFLGDIKTVTLNTWQSLKCRRQNLTVIVNSQTGNKRINFIYFI